jgi:hypothetical protein
MYDFGPLAAQNDDQLLRYFHTTRQATAMIDFRLPQPSFIFVARPGAGKTALLKWLTTRTVNHVPLIIRPDDTRLFSDDAVSNTGDIKVMIAAELFTALVSEIANRKLGSPGNLKAAKEFISTGWIDIIGKFFKHKFSGLSILGCGFTLKLEERRDYLREIRGTGRITASREILRRIAAEVKVSLVIDDPELIVGQGLQDVTDENALRLGAFLSILADVHSLGIRVVVFLKEHILQNTRAHYHDFRHFADRIDGLEWTADDLLAMLGDRVAKRLNSKWEKVFDTTPEAMRDDIFPWLVNGPRDLLCLCNLAGKENGKISEKRLEKAVRALRSEKWGELASHYGKQWPKIDLFARAMISALSTKYRTKPFPPSAVKTLFEAQHADPESEIHALRKVPWIDSARWDNPPVDEKLFLIGCLGYVYDEKWNYPWAGRSVDHFRLADLHFISPLFLE